MKMQGGDLFDRIVSMENLRNAHHKARKGKAHYQEVKWVNQNEDAALKHIQELLISGTFNTSPYRIEEAMKGEKMRTIHKLPYFPDRIVQHAIVNICAPIWIKSMIRDTFQSIPGRGSFDCYNRVRKAVQGAQPRYAIKIDIVKFYPSVQNKHLLNPKVFRVKCKRTLGVLENIICSLPCLPLGNHTSQYGGNLVLSPIDWYAKQRLKLKHYFRYCDDIVIMSNCKIELMNARAEIGRKLAAIDLIMKHDETIVDLKTEPLDFVGYRITHDKVKLRRRMAARFKATCKAGNVRSLPSYYGWCKHANALNLYNKHVIKAKRPWKSHRAKNYRSSNILA